MSPLYVLLLCIFIYYKKKERRQSETHTRHSHYYYHYYYYHYLNVQIIMLTCRFLQKTVFFFLYKPMDMRRFCSLSKYFIFIRHCIMKNWNCGLTSNDIYSYNIILYYQYNYFYVKTHMRETSTCDEINVVDDQTPITRVSWYNIITRVLCIIL